MKDREEPSTPSLMGLTDGRIEKKAGAENGGGRGVSSIQDVKRSEERVVGVVRDRGEPSKPSMMGLTNQEVGEGGGGKRRREDDSGNVDSERARGLLL